MIAFAACGSTPSPSPVGIINTAAGAIDAAAGAGFACTPPGKGPFPTVECRHPGSASERDYVRMYGRPDGTLAGVEALVTSASERPGDPPAVIVVLEPVLRASVDPSTADQVLAVVGSHLNGAATPIQISPDLQVRIVAAGNGRDVAVIAPDLAAIWGHPPKP